MVLRKLYKLKFVEVNAVYRQISNLVELPTYLELLFPYNEALTLRDIACASAMSV